MGHSIQVSPFRFNSGRKCSRSASVRLAGSLSAGTPSYGPSSSSDSVKRAFRVCHHALASAQAPDLARRKKRYARLPTSDEPPVPLDPTAASTPGVSILRPLRGLDCNLYENLEASFRQDYRKFEIIFSVADEADAAIPIVKELCDRYPNVQSKLIVGEHSSTGLCHDRNP